MKKSYNAFLNFRRELLERNHRCASCPAAFKKIAHLKAHSLRHTGEKPFKCATCDKYVYFRCLMVSTNQADPSFFLLQNLMNIDGLQFTVYLL